MKKLIDFTVTENKRLNHDTILLVLHSDELPEIQPGQFVNVRVDHSPSTFLRRPISVHDVDESRGLLYLFIKIVGCGTSTLGELQIGDKVNVMLPLGNHFSIPTSGRPLLIGGGCGVAPMLHLSRIMKAQGLSPVVLIGTRTDKDILRKEEYEKYATVYYTTEDGSFGEKGYVTQHSVLKEKFDHIYCLLGDYRSLLLLKLSIAPAILFLRYTYADIVCISRCLKYKERGIIKQIGRAHV